MTSRFPSDNIFIYCDHPGHPDKVEAVENFAPFNYGGDWGEAWVPQPRSRNRDATTTSLKGDELVAETFDRLRGDAAAPTAEAIIAWSDTDPRDLRTVYTLQCRRCQGRPRTLDQLKLNAALDALRAAGLSRISLLDLDRIVQTQSQLRKQRGG